MTRSRVGSTRNEQAAKRRERACRLRFRILGTPAKPCLDVGDFELLREATDAWSLRRDTAVGYDNPLLNASGGALYWRLEALLIGLSTSARGGRRTAEGFARSVVERWATRCGYRASCSIDEIRYNVSTHGDPSGECATLWRFYYDSSGTARISDEAYEVLLDLLIGWAESLNLCITGGSGWTGAEPRTDGGREPELAFTIHNPLPDAVVNRDSAEQLVSEVIVPWAEHFGLTLEGGFEVSMPAPPELVQARLEELAKG